MNLFDLLGIEFMKVKPSKIIPSDFYRSAAGCGLRGGVSQPALHAGILGRLALQSTLVYGYYLLPFSMIVVCVMIAGQETRNNGILKIPALSVSRKALPLAKFLILTFYLFMETVVFLAVFAAAAMIAVSTMGLTEAFPILYLLKWCIRLFLTMLPCLAAMWVIRVFLLKAAAFRWPKSAAGDS